MAGMEVISHNRGEDWQQVLHLSVAASASTPKLGFVSTCGAVGETRQKLTAHLHWGNQNNFKDRSLFLGLKATWK